MAEDPVEEMAYDLAPEQAPRPVMAAKAPAVGGQTLQYRSTGGDVRPGADPEVIRDLYMPLWLLGGGVAVEVVAALIRGPVPRALFGVGINLILGTAVMLAGIVLAARWRGIDLGGFWTAAFKLAAVAVAPSAAVTLVTPVLRLVPLGGLLGWAGEFVLYFALLGALFDLDQSDTWYCVLVIFLVRLAVFFSLLAFFATRQ
jgi:hypothetical protein